MKPSEPHCYTLTIRALPDRVPADQRLRGVLKRLLRSYGFKCLVCQPCPGHQQHESEKDPVESNERDTTQARGMESYVVRDQIK
jgi:hypothetical protein